MASEIDIVNMALANIGDDANVASLYPAEGSAQAEHCARFYPIARDMVLESHSWSFSTRRVAGALLTTETTVWDYAYAKPADAIRILGVIPADAVGDVAYLPMGSAVPAATSPREFTVESLADGTTVIYTDLENAVIVYQARVEDTTKYPPMVVLAIAWQLSALLAGPVIKGTDGAAEGQRCAQVAMAYLEQAKALDANQQHRPLVQQVPWIAGR